MKEAFLLLVSLTLVLQHSLRRMHPEFIPVPGHYNSHVTVTTPQQTQPAVTTQTCSLVPGPTQIVPVV